MPIDEVIRRLQDIKSIYPESTVHFGTSNEALNNQIVGMNAAIRLSHDVSGRVFLITKS